MWKQFHNNIHTIIKNIKIKKNAKKKKTTKQILTLISLWISVEKRKKKQITEKNRGDTLIDKEK